MAVKFQVLTTTEFADMDAAEEWLKNASPFKPSQAVQLLEEGTLEIKETADFDQGYTTKETTSTFTLKEE